VLGSTGSIGTQTLEIASEQPDKFKAVALSAGRNINLLTEQVKTHKPEVVAIEDENLIEDLKDNINNLDLDSAPLVWVERRELTQFQHGIRQILW